MIIYNYCWDSQLNSRPIIQNNLSEIPAINKVVRQ